MANNEQDWSLWWDQKPAQKAGEWLVRWNDEGMRSRQLGTWRAYLYAQAYEGFAISNIGAHLGEDLGHIPKESFPIVDNKIREIVNAWVALVAGNDTPVPQFVTNGADYEQALRAENLDEVINEELSRSHGTFANCAELDRQGVKMAASSTGGYWVFVFAGEGRPECELDDGMTISVVRDRQFGRILVLSRSTLVDPEWAIARYPKAKAKILELVEHVDPMVFSGSDPLRGRAVGGHARDALSRRVRRVRIVQGWRVATKSKGKEQLGRELFCLRDGTKLEDNDYPWDSPPGEQWVFERDLSGENGVSMTQDFYWAFMRKNEMLFACDRAEHNTPQEVWLTQKGTGESEAVAGQLSGAVGVKIVEVTGNLSSAIKVVDNHGLKRNSLQLIEMYDAICHEQSAVSKSHSGATRQPGTQSGIHEVYSASYFSERYADQERRLVEFRAVTRARLMARAMKDVCKGRYSVWVGDKGKRRELTPDDFDLDESKYVIDIKPVSEEKGSPATRLKKIERLAQDPASGVTGRDLVDAYKTFDADRVEQQMTALDDLVEEYCKRWRKQSLDKPFRVSPQKYWQLPGLQSALRIVAADHDRAALEGVPEERLVYHQQFMNECIALIDAAKQREAQIMAQAAGRTANVSSQPGPAGAPGSGAPGSGPAIA